MDKNMTRTFEEVRREFFQDYYPNYVNGRWSDASDGGKIEVVCPANGQKLTTAADTTKEDLDEAIQTAWAAWPKWRNIEMSRKYAILTEAYNRLKAKAQDLMMVEAVSTGKAVNTLPGEFNYALEQFPYFASVMRTAEDAIFSAAAGSRTMIVREPLGVIGSIAPWNAPFLMACYKIAPAIAAGNCVILKPSSYTPAPAMELMKVIADLLPPGVVNIVNGKGFEVGHWLLDHPGISKLSFTGSTDIGTKVGLAAAKRIIPCTLELGGKSAGIYFADIPREKYSKAIPNALQILALTGQGCAIQTRLLVQEPIYDMFVDQISNIVKNVRVGMPWDPATNMGSLTYEAHMKNVLAYIEQGKKEGARLVCGGNRITTGEMGKGCFVEPTIFADVDNKMVIAQEEIFGPVACFIKFKDEEDAIRIANDSKYGLGGGIWTGDLSKALRVATAIRTGTVHINDAVAPAAGSAFGGFKASGLGRENYKVTFDEYSIIKTINFAF